MKASRAVVPSGKNAPSLNRVSSCRLTPSRLFGSIVSQKPLALYSRRLSTPTNAQTQLTHSLSCWVCCPSKISFDTVRKWFNTRAAVNFAPDASAPPGCCCTVVEIQRLPRNDADQRGGSPAAHFLWRHRGSISGHEHAWAIRADGAPSRRHGETPGTIEPGRRWQWGDAGQ